MAKFKQTTETAEKFNNMLHDYQNIDSDSALEQRKLSYDTYRNMGFLIDCLRYDGSVTVDDESLVDYFKSFGFSESKIDAGYLINL